MMLRFLFISLLSLCFQLQAQHRMSLERSEKMVSLLNAKDSTGLLQQMADTCRIGNLPLMDNTKVIPDILSKYHPIDSYHLDHDTLFADGSSLISLSVKYADGKTGNPTFLFNTAGKLINLGIIKGRMKGHPENALALALSTATKPDTMRIRFQMENDLIYVPAMLNGKNGYFMFDSGAPVVILRKKYLPDAFINNDVSVDFAGIGGKMEDVRWSKGNTLAWGG